MCTESDNLAIFSINLTTDRFRIVRIQEHVLPLHDLTMLTQQ
jgi:hypothetical protein